VIQFEGKPVHSIERSWATACRAGNIELIPHDIRRTSVTNMIAAGYMIASESMAIRAGQRLEAWTQEQNQYKTPVQDSRTKRPN